MKVVSGATESEAILPREPGGLFLQVRSREQDFLVPVMKVAVYGKDQDARCFDCAVAGRVTDMASYVQKVEVPAVATPCPGAGGA